jgi:hypothetical protein
MEYEYKNCARKCYDRKVQELPFISLFPNSVLKIMYNHVIT